MESGGGDTLGFVNIGELTCLACMAGGDWQEPVFFIIYWDGKDFRGYIPKDGNLWNYKYNFAIGDGEDGEDFEFLKSLNPSFVEIDSDGDGWRVDNLYDLMRDEEKMKIDIVNRIQVG